MKKINLVSSVLLLIFSGSLYYVASTFPVRAGRVAVLNPGFYPQLLAGILAVLAVLLLITALMQKSQIPKKFLEGTSKRSKILLGITVCMLILFPIILEYFGFTIATFIFMAVLIYSLSDRKKYSVLTMFLVTLANTTAIYLVFKLFLKIPFPRGFFFE